MHIALWTTGLAALIFIAAALFVSRMPTQNADDAGGAAFLGFFLGIVGASCAVSWLALVIFKAANA